jgi:hypothetical protein
MRLFAAPWRRRPAREGSDDSLEDLARRLQEISEGHGIPAQHVAAARSRMRLALAEVRRRPAAGLGWPDRVRRPLAAAAAVAVVLLAGGALSVLLGGSGGPGIIGSRTAEAVVLTGTLEAQGGGFTLLTDAGPQPISLGAQATIVDAAGNPMPIDALTRGQQVSVKAKRDDNDHLVVDEIHAKSEVRGRITSLSAGQMEITGQRTSITVLITATTRVKGSLALGQLVEVEVERNAAGDLVAREIDAEDEGHGNDDSGLPAAPTATAGPALSPAPVKDGDGQRQSAPLPTAPPPTLEAGKTAAAPAPGKTPDPERETENSDPAPQATSGPPPQQTASAGSGRSGGDSHDGHDDEHDGGHDR